MTGIGTRMFMAIALLALLAPPLLADLTPQERSLVILAKQGVNDSLTMNLENQAKANEIKNDPNATEQIKQNADQIIANCQVIQALLQGSFDNLEELLGTGGGGGGGDD